MSKTASYYKVVIVTKILRPLLLVIAVKIYFGRLNEL